MKRDRRLTAKFYKTKQLVLNYLAKANKAVTADELYINMRTEQEVISMTTVYKYLTLLADSGIVIEESTDKAREYKLLSLT